MDRVIRYSVALKGGKDTWPDVSVECSVLGFCLGFKLAPRSTEMYEWSRALNIAHPDNLAEAFHVWDGHDRGQDGR